MAEQVPPPLHNQAEISYLQSLSYISSLDPRTADVNHHAFTTHSRDQILNHILNRKFDPNPEVEAIYAKLHPVLFNTKPIDLTEFDFTTSTHVESPWRTFPACDVTQLFEWKDYKEEVKQAPGRFGRGDAILKGHAVRKKTGDKKLDRTYAALTSWFQKCSMQTRGGGVYLINYMYAAFMCLPPNALHTKYPDPHLNKYTGQPSHDSQIFDRVWARSPTLYLLSLIYANYNFKSPWFDVEDTIKVVSLDKPLSSALPVITYQLVNTLISVSLELLDSQCETMSLRFIAMCAPDPHGFHLKYKSACRYPLINKLFCKQLTGKVPVYQLLQDEAFVEAVRDMNSGDIEDVDTEGDRAILDQVAGWPLEARKFYIDMETIVKSIHTWSCSTADKVRGLLHSTNPGDYKISPAVLGLTEELYGKNKPMSYVHAGDSYGCMPLGELDDEYWTFVYTYYRGVFDKGMSRVPDPERYMENFTRWLTNASSGLSGLGKTGDLSNGKRFIAHLNELHLYSSAAAMKDAFDKMAGTGVGEPYDTTLHQDDTLSDEEEDNDPMLAPGNLNNPEYTVNVFYRQQIDRRSRAVYATPNVVQAVLFPLYCVVSDHVAKSPMTVAGDTTGTLKDIGHLLYGTSKGTQWLNYFGDISSMDTNIQSFVPGVFLRAFFDSCASVVYPYYVGHFATTLTTSFGNNLSVTAFQHFFLHFATYLGNARFHVQDRVLGITQVIQILTFLSGIIITATHHSIFNEANVKYIEMKMNKRDGQMVHRMASILGDDVYTLNSSDDPKRFKKIYLAVTNEVFDNAALTITPDMKSKTAEFLKMLAMNGAYVPFSARTSLLCAERRSTVVRSPMDHMKDVSTILSTLVSRGANDYKATAYGVALCNTFRTIRVGAHFITIPLVFLFLPNGPSLGMPLYHDLMPIPIYGPMGAVRYYVLRQRFLTLKSQGVDLDLLMERDGWLFAKRLLDAGVVDVSRIVSDRAKNTVYKPLIDRAVATLTPHKMKEASDAYSSLRKLGLSLPDTLKYTNLPQTQLANALSSARPTPVERYRQISFNKQLQAVKRTGTFEDFTYPRFQWVHSVTVKEKHPSLHVLPILPGIIAAQHPMLAGISGIATPHLLWTLMMLGPELHARVKDKIKQTVALSVGRAMGDPEVQLKYLKRGFIAGQDAFIATATSMGIEPQLIPKLHSEIKQSLSAGIGIGDIFNWTFEHPALFGVRIDRERIKQVVGVVVNINPRSAFPSFMREFGLGVMLSSVRCFHGVDVLTTRETFGSFSKAWRK